MLPNCHGPRNSAYELLLSEYTSAGAGPPITKAATELAKWSWGEVVRLESFVNRRNLQDGRSAQKRAVARLDWLLEKRLVFLRHCRKRRGSRDVGLPRQRRR